MVAGANGVRVEAVEYSRNSGIGRISRSDVDLLLVKPCSQLSSHPMTWQQQSEVQIPFCFFAMPIISARWPVNGTSYNGVLPDSAGLNPRK